MAKHTLKQGLIDYLETLQMAGVSEISAERKAQSAKKEPEVKRSATSGHATQHAEQNTEQHFSGGSQNRDQNDRHDQTLNRDDQLKQIADVVCKCKKCPELVANRTQTVFGVGNPFAELVFLGEAPGADEDKQGIPFVGRAGKLLTDMIEKGMRLKREDVYICNILRCRPPGNRNPDPVEAAHCRTFLDATLEVIQPKYLCCLGSIAATNLLDSQETIGRMRGRIFDHQGIKVVCTYHPAYLLRNPSAKTAAWEDLQLLMRIMALPIPQKNG